MEVKLLIWNRSWKYGQMELKTVSFFDIPTVFVNFWSDSPCFVLLTYFWTKQTLKTSDKLQILFFMDFTRNLMNFLLNSWNYTERISCMTFIDFLVDLTFKSWWQLVRFLARKTLSPFWGYYWYLAEVLSALSFLKRKNNFCFYFSDVLAYISHSSRFRAVIPKVGESPFGSDFQVQRSKYL